MRGHQHRIWLALSVGLLLCLALAGTAASMPEAEFSPERASGQAATPEQLVAASVWEMVANATHLFWTVSVGGEFCPTDGEPAIRRMPLGGGTVETLYHSCSFSPHELALDATYVYFADWTDNKIKRLPVTGGTPSAIATGSELILYRGLALDGTYVYWVDALGIRRAPKTGGAAQTLVSSTLVNSLAVDSTHLYWTTQGAGTGQVQRLPVTGGTPQTLATGLQDPSAITLGATQVFFGETGTGKVYHMGKDGSGLAAYFTSSISPYVVTSIAVDSTNVYWSDTTSLHDGRIRRVPLGGGTVENLVLGLFGPASVHLTGSHAYWGDADGIWRLPLGASEVKVDLSITSMEVTQGIQCLDNTTGATACADNSVPLVTDRLTYARVYPTVTLADTPNVIARLFGTKGGAALPGSPLAPEDPTVYVRQSGAQRENATDSLNFQLPPSWRSGTIVLQAEINPGQPIPESNTSNNLSSQVTITFSPARSLKVAYVPIKYTWSGWKGSATASIITMMAAENYLRSLLPVSQLTYYPWPSGDAFSKAITITANANELLAKLNERYLASNNPPDQLFGWFPNGSWSNGKSDPKWLGGASAVSAGDENLAPAVIAHEIGHNLGRRHPTCADSQSDWPYGIGTSSIQEVGFDVYQRTAWPATTRDWMVGGNCGNSSLSMWASPWNWTQIVNKTMDWMASAAAMPMIIVTGEITQTGGRLRPLWVVEQALPPSPLPEGSAYCLGFYDRSNVLPLLQHCFDVDLNSSPFRDELPGGVFAMRLALPANTARVRLSQGTTMLDERRASAHAPTVSVTGPNGGESWSAKHTVSWTASDADGDQLTYQVQYSADAGGTWESLASGLTDTSLEVDAAQLPGSQNALVRVLASDGMLTGHDDSDATFTVAYHRPQVRILSPATGKGYEPGQLIVLTGSAYDLEDGPLTGESLIWSIEGSGPMAAGPEAALRLTASGEYTVTLAAADSNRMTAEDHIVIFVGANVYLSPGYHAIDVGETITVEIRLDAVSALYGAQVELSFDPQIVQVVDAYDFAQGVQIREGDLFPVPMVHMNVADNATGRIQYVASLRGQQRGVTGSGVLARITFRGRQAGLSRVRFARVVLSDPYSGQMPARSEDGAIAVQPLSGAVSGQVHLERRTSDAGSRVCLGDLCVTTPAGGGYGLTDMPVGVYTMMISRTSYLRSSRTVVITNSALALPDVTLLGGEMNQDGRIEVADGLIICNSWNSAVGGARWDPRADVNDDGQVNVLDLVAVTYNWDARAPGPWPETLEQRKSSPSVHKDSGTAKASTQVVITPTLSTLSGVGQSGSLQVWVHDVAHLSAVRVQLSFDPQVIRILDADPRPSAPGVQVAGGDFLDVINQQMLVNQVNNDAGTIDFAVAQTYPATPRTGSGMLVTVLFTTVGSGSSPVHFDNVRLLDDTWPDPLDIPAQTFDGQVRVGAMQYMPLVLK